MNTLTLAIALSEKLYKSHIKVLKYFLENPIFEGSYRELSNILYGKPNLQSNARKFVNELADMGVLMVIVNNDCPSRDQSRTYIQLNPDWIKRI
jgi:hypothetical protein